MACKITRQQVRTAILDQAFNEMFEGRNTFSRVSDDTIQINNKADNAKTKAQSKEQAYNIAQERLESIRTSFR